MDILPSRYIQDVFLSTYWYDFKCVQESVLSMISNTIGGVKELDEHTKATT